MNGKTTKPASYLVENCSMPFCKGCGHTHVIRKLNEALLRLRLQPRDVCLVTDIGCIGLADGLFESIHTVHTTHGRSTAFATGVELADSILGDSRLKTVVLIGDGGAMIGLLHLVNAALINVDVTVLLCNNFLFGMTGGQNSAFSPVEFITPTTPRGNIVPPIDMCHVMIDAHAQYVARKLATDKDLPETIARAIASPGFSLVEIVELCTEYATTKNQLSGTAIQHIMEQHGQKMGVLAEKGERLNFESLYSSKFPRVAPAAAGGSDIILPKFDHKLAGKRGLVLAGSAGERVQSAAAMFCEAAARARLFCTQKNDNPVTQGSGFSLSEICISPTEIAYTGIDRPDDVIVVSDDGFQELKDRGVFHNMLPRSRLILDASLDAPSTNADLLRFPFRSLCGGEKSTLGALMYYLRLSEIFPVEAYDELVRRKFRSESSIFSGEFHSALSDLPQTHR